MLKRFLQEVCISVGRDRDALCFQYILGIWKVWSSNHRIICQL